MNSWRWALGGALYICSFGLYAQVSDHVVKLGVLTDLSGPYSGFAGPGSVVAAQMAVDDFGGKVLGQSIVVIAGDHQNKPDVGASLARRWIDTDQVDAIVDVPASAVALAVQQVTTEKNRIFLASGPTTSELTGKACGPTTAHWTSDSYALAVGTARALVRRGADTWYFLTVDNAGGKALEKDAGDEVLRSGGKILGHVNHPLNNPDFSAYLLQAQATKPKILALANAGSDMTNAVKVAREFGVQGSGIQVVGLFMNITDAKSLGLASAQSIALTEAWYWDLNDQTRAFAKRFYSRHKAMPTQYQAGVYSAVGHYLKAVQAAGTDEALATIAKMREMPITDMFAVNGKLRIDGRMVHDMYLMQVKTPAESKSEWDIYKVLATTPGDQAFRPLAESACPLVKGKA